MENNNHNNNNTATTVDAATAAVGANDMMWKQHLTVISVLSVLVGAIATILPYCFNVTTWILSETIILLFNTTTDTESSSSSSLFWGDDVSESSSSHTASDGDTNHLYKMANEWGLSGLLTHLLELVRDQCVTLIMFLPTLFMGTNIVYYRSKRFAKEGFHDMFSISMNMFVKDEQNRDVLAVRTLKEVPIGQFLFDEGAMEILKTAAQQSLKESRKHESTPSTTTTTGAFHFCNLVHLPDARRNVSRLRSHCAAELSALFGVFQALAAMRVGPIVSRKFCWVVTYEEEVIMDEQKYGDENVDGETDRLHFSLKTVAKSVVAIRRLAAKKHNEFINRKEKENMIEGDSINIDDLSDLFPNEEKKSKEILEEKEKLPQEDQHEEELNKDSSPSNKFRMILIELDCLRRAHLKSTSDLHYEVPGRYFRRRWETIQAMQSLFDLKSGMPRSSTILCGSVTFSAPLMDETELHAPWESWQQDDIGTSYEQARRGAIKAA